MIRRCERLQALYDAAAKEPPRLCKGPCGKTKAASEFYVQRGARGVGYISGRCKECFRAQVRAKQKAKAAAAAGGAP